MKTKAQKIAEVCDKLDRRIMTEEEFNLATIKVITKGIVIILCTLMICITTYNCIDRVHPEQRLQVIKKFVENM